MNNLAHRLEKRILEHGVSNKELVQIIEVAGDYLGLKTISQYAKENNISYNGAKKYRENITLFGVKFIIDND